MEEREREGESFVRQVMHLCECGTHTERERKRVCVCVCVRSQLIKHEPRTVSQVSVMRRKVEVRMVKKGEMVVVVVRGAAAVVVVVAVVQIRKKQETGIVSAVIMVTGHRSLKTKQIRI